MTTVSWPNWAISATVMEPKKISVPVFSETPADAASSGAEANESTFDDVRLSVRRFLQRGAIANLTNVIARLHPADVARAMMQLDTPQARRTVFELVKDAAEQGQVVSELSDEVILEVLDDRNAAEIALMLRTAPADDAADILGVLPEALAQNVLPFMQTDDSREVAHLMAYPKGTAGSIMTTEFVALPEDTVVRDALLRLQQATRAETVFYVYATDREGRLAGVISLRELLTAPPTARLKSLLFKDVVTVGVETDQKEVAVHVARYNLLAIPVIDAGRRLAGIITVDDVVDVIRDEDTKEMLKMAGAAEEDAFMSAPSLQAAGKRFPWLLTNLAGSLVSGLILWWFRFAIQEVVAIVTFIPVIAAMSGNLGLQSSTLIIRGLATGRIEPGNIRKVLFRELRIGLLLGVLYGSLLFLAGWWWQRNGFLGLVVGGALLATFILSASLATVTPFLLKKLRIDPAVAAGPFITTAMDILGVSIYLGLATLMLESLRYA